MLPNVVPEGYARRSKLAFPLALRNTQQGAWIKLFFLAGFTTALFRIVLSFCMNNATSLNFSVNRLIKGTQLLVLVFSAYGFWYLLSPFQEVIIQSDEIITRSARSKKILKKVPINNVDYISICTEYVSDTNLFLWVIMNPIYLWFGLPGKKKIVLHLKEGDEKILFDCPSQNDMDYAENLGLLLNAPFRL